MLFLPVFVRMLTEHPVYKETLQELRRFDDMSAEEQEIYQLEKLRTTLIEAKEHVAYYRNIFHENGFDPTQLTSFEDLKRIPLLTKERAIEAGESLYSDDKISYYTALTGGSSGKTLQCLLDQNSYYQERACLTHFLSEFGYDPKKDRTVSFYGHNQKADYYFSPMKADICISPFRLFQEEQFESIFQLVERFKPSFITCYASAIVQFARLCQKNNKTLKLKGVLFTSENWSEQDKLLVERVFACPIVSTYGHTERAVFGVIRQDGNCSFNRLYGFTELLPTDVVDEYQIVCTGFISKKMPLIRYVTDDAIKITSDGKYNLIGHRKSDVKLIGKHGEEIFKGAMTMHIDILKKVKTYQYVQDEVGKVSLHIVPEEVITEEDQAEILSYLKHRCEGLLDVDLKIVDDVIRSPRGKHIWAISNLE